MRGPLIFLGIVAAGAGALVATTGGDDAPTPEPQPAVSSEAPPASSATRTAAADLPTMTVYKSPTCGCCGDWIEHLREHGFEVQVEDVSDLMAVKTRMGVPSEMSSCHTGIIGGYLVEGHVPAEDLERFLAEAPDADGLAVPGMPVGSPGMEVPGTPAQPYQVLAFDRDGSSSVFARH